jgi:hypothetical protein
LAPRSGTGGTQDHEQIGLAGEDKPQVIISALSTRKATAILIPAIYLRKRMMGQSVNRSAIPPVENSRNRSEAISAADLKFRVYDCIELSSSSSYFWNAGLFAAQ